MSKKTSTSLLFIVVIAIIALFAATDVMAVVLPNSCDTGEGSPNYKIRLNQVEGPVENPVTLQDEFIFHYELEFKSAAVRKKVNRVVIVFNRPLLVDQITYPPNSPVLFYGDEDPATKAGRGNTSNFVRSFEPEPPEGEENITPFEIKSLTDSRGLITFSFDLGKSGLQVCKSDPDNMEGPAGIEGPGFYIAPSPYAVAEVDTVSTLGEGGSIAIKKHPVTGCIKTFYNPLTGVPIPLSNPANWPEGLEDLVNGLLDAGNLEDPICREFSFAQSSSEPITWWSYVNGGIFCLGQWYPTYTDWVSPCEYYRYPPIP